MDLLLGASSLRSLSLLALHKVRSQPLPPPAARRPAPAHPRTLGRYLRVRCCGDAPTRFYGARIAQAARAHGSLPSLSLFSSAPPQGQTADLRVLFALQNLPPLPNQEDADHPVRRPAPRACRAMPRLRGCVTLPAPYVRLAAVVPATMLAQKSRRRMPQLLRTSAC